MSNLTYGMISSGRGGLVIFDFSGYLVDCTVAARNRLVIPWCNDTGR